MKTPKTYPGTPYVIFEKTDRPKIPADDAKAWQKEARHYRRYLAELSNTTLAFLAALDELMGQPSTVERGRAVAKIRNALEMANDGARYFGLGVDYKRDKKRPVRVPQT